MCQIFYHIVLDICFNSIFTFIKFVVQYKIYFYNIRSSILFSIYNKIFIFIWIVIAYIIKYKPVNIANKLLRFEILFILKI